MAFNPDEYLESFDPDSYLDEDVVVAEPRPNQTRANKILTDGIMYDATPEQIAAANLLSKEEMDMQTYIAHANAKHGTNFTPVTAQANLKYEYGEGATAATANAQNKKAGKWMPDPVMRRFTDPETGLSVELPFAGVEPTDPTLFQKPERTVANALGSFIERTKAGVKALPELTTATLAMAGLQQPTDPTGRPLGDAENFAKLRAEASKQIEQTPIFKDLRKSMLPNVKSAAEFAQRYRGSKSQSLLESAKQGNWSQFGADLHDAFALETPNFAAIMALSMANPALGLSYAGTSSAADRYATGITEGESPEEASRAAVAYGLAEVGFEWAGSVGMISGAMKRKAKGEIIENFGRKALEFAREPSTEIATQITQNIVDQRPWYEGVPEAGLVGLGFGAGITAFTLGDANRTRKQNTNEQIDAIVENAPIPEAQKPLMEDMLKNPSEESTEAFNAFEPDPVAEEGTTPEGEPVTVVDSEAIIPEHGQPFSFEFVRNTERAPDVGGRYWQDI